MNRSAGYFLILGIVAMLLSGPALAETVKDREGAVRGDKAKMENSERWIYNDIDAGFAKAKETGKPLMVVLRCVPCIACAGIDSEVLIENSQLTPLMDQFVLVRVINANALDLSRFQFDYDLSFTTMFFHADGTVYGRYGSWEHQYDGQNRATDTFRQALEGALQLHASYPRNRSLLAGKQGEKIPYQTPLDIPAMDDQFRSELNWKGNVVKSCVHCHQIGDALRRTLREKNDFLPLQLIYPHPSPATLGLTLDGSSIRSIASVAENSAAATSGVQAGDQILRFDGQAVISTADVSWALHRLPDSGTLTLTIQRGGNTRDVELPLKHGWRADNGMNKRVGNWPMRAMAFGGMKLDEMDEADRESAGIPEGKMALFATHVGQYGAHALAKKQGFKKEDILLEVDGSREPASEGQLIATILQTRKPGDRIPAVVLRGGKEIELKIPVQ